MLFSFFEMIVFENILFLLLAPRQCSSTQFKCNNSRCIAASMRCVSLFYLLFFLIKWDTFRIMSKIAVMEVMKEHFAVRFSLFLLVKNNAFEC